MAVKQSFFFCPVTLLFVCSFASKSVAQENDSPDQIARKHANLIKIADAKMNIRQARRILPSVGMRLSSNHEWTSSMSRGVGHEFKILGSVKGDILFSNREGSNKYSESDTINTVYFYFPSNYDNSPRLCAEYVKALSRYLRPTVSQKMEKCYDGKTRISVDWGQKKGLLLYFDYRDGHMRLSLSNPNGPAHE